MADLDVFDLHVPTAEASGAVRISRGEPASVISAEILVIHAFRLGKANKAGRRRVLRDVWRLSNLGRRLRLFLPSEKG